MLMPDRELREMGRDLVTRSHRAAT